MTQASPDILTPSAEELRAKAQELLIQAHKLDGKQLYAVVVTGSIMDNPDLAFTLSEKPPTEDEATELSDSAPHLVANGRVILTVKHIPVSKLF